MTIVCTMGIVVFVYSIISGHGITTIFVGAGLFVCGLMLGNIAKKANRVYISSIGFWATIINGGVAILFGLGIYFADLAFIFGGLGITIIALPILRSRYKKLINERNQRMKELFESKDSEGWGV